MASGSPHTLTPSFQKEINRKKRDSDLLFILDQVNVLGRVLSLSSKDSHDFNSPEFGADIAPH